MSDSKKTKVVPAEKVEKKELSGSMKALSNSIKISSFDTNFQFTKQLGIELLKGSNLPEHIEVLKESIKGMKEFIILIEDEIKKRSAK